MRVLPRLTATALTSLAASLVLASPAMAHADEVAEGEDAAALAEADEAVADDEGADEEVGASSDQQTQLSREEAELIQRFVTSVFAGDWITVGAGLGAVPSYEGSDNYVLFPVPQITGSVDGYSFSSPGGPGIVVDLIKDSPLADVSYIAGPLIRVNLNRAIQSQINDPVVEALGDLDAAVEIGGRFGVSFNNVFVRFDSVTVQTDIAADIAGAHEGVIVSPSISYQRLVGDDTVLIGSVSASWVDDNYASYYYGVDAAGSLASGLPQFNAGGGVKSVSATFVGAFDLSGDALDGGWGAFVLVGYSRLREAAGNTPITTLRGDADQFIGGAGISYTF